MGCLLVADPVLGAPTVTSVAPAAGPTSGSTPVTITGTGFVEGATVEIGNVACTEVRVVDATRIHCVNGAHAAGETSVTIFNTPIDSSGTNSFFTYDSSTDLTKTTKSDFETAGAQRTNLVTTGLDSTLRWIDWSPATGGAMTPATYYYVVTATNAVGETPRSVRTWGVVLGLGQTSVQLDWTPIAGALQYKLYRTTTAGSYGPSSLVATLDTTGHEDTSPVLGSGAPPGVTTATGDLYLSRGGTSGGFTDGPDVTGTLSSDGFSILRPDGTFLVVHGRSTSSTSVYDPVGNTMTAGPDLTDNAQDGSHGMKRPNGTFLIVHGNNKATTSIYDPVANTIVAGPEMAVGVDHGGHALERPNGTFLIIHGDATVTTSVYDPVANTMVAGPVLTDTARQGGHGFRRPDGQYVIVHGDNSTTTSLYEPLGSTMSVGPTTTDDVGNGGHAVQRPDGRFLIVHGNGSRFTTLYDPVANTRTSGPELLSSAGFGAHSIQRADGTFLVFTGGGSQNTNEYDPVANAIAAGPDLTGGVGRGGHSLQRPDGQYLIVQGGISKQTTFYDAGWETTGNYTSEKLHPSDINFWNTISWVQDADESVAVQIRTATSSGGLDAASWRAVSNGGNVGAEPGETWLQIQADFERAIPRSSLVGQDVWGRTLHEFRRFEEPGLASLTANYTSTGLSVSPSGSMFLFGGEPHDTWLEAESSSLRNDGSVAETLVGEISTFTSTAGSWSISPVTNGPDQIRAQWSTASDTGPWTDIAAYDQDFTIATSVAAGDSVQFYFRIQTPTTSPEDVEYASLLTIWAR